MFDPSPFARPSASVALVALVSFVVAACSGGASSSTTDATVIPSAATDAPTTTVASTEPASTTSVPTPATTASAATTAPPVTVAPTTTPPPAAATTQPLDVTVLPVGPKAEELVGALADDALGGRDNQSPGGAAARELIIEELSTFARPLPGLDGYTQEFGLGTNVLGVVPGSDLADEYVIVGGHYDHLGDFGCNRRTADDQICNGAADNASGVAAALLIGRSIAAASPRRSVVVALWDAEEDGLLGASHYVEQPVVPLESTVAYVNFDLIGSNLLPSLSNLTIAIGAESGGVELADATRAAADSSSLDVASLSIVFGQGRSDHAPFAAAEVPIVFFGDATNGCYHTVDDEVEQVDFAKMEQQIAIGTALVSDLVSTDSPPAFDVAAPLATFDDVVAIRDLLATAQPDFEAFGDGAGPAQAFLDQLDQILADGVSQFDADDVGLLLGGAAELISNLAATSCP